MGGRQKKKKRVQAPKRRVLCMRLASLALESDCLYLKTKKEILCKGTQRHSHTHAYTKGQQAKKKRKRRTHGDDTRKIDGACVIKKKKGLTHPME